MIELSKVIDCEGHFASLGEVLEASIVVQRQYVDVRKGDASVYTGMLEQARVIFGNAKTLFEQKGINDPEARYYTFAADQWVAQARQEVAAGSTKGYTDSEMGLFNRYTKELYDAMSVEAPFLEVDAKSGKPVLGGRSAVAKWMKDFREKKEQAQRAKSAEAEKLLGIKPKIVTPEQAEASSQSAETGSVLDMIADPAVRKAMEDYILKVAETVEAGDTKGALNQVEAATRHVANHLKNSIAKLRKAAAA